MKHNDRYGDYIIEKTDRIREFDCHVLSIDFKNGGGFSTGFPISDKKYREVQEKKFPDKVVITEDSEYTTFIITDDWGNKYMVAIDNIHYSAIQHAKDKAKEYGLLAL